jgi:hypothetical protein
MKYEQVGSATKVMAMLLVFALIIPSASVFGQETTLQTTQQTIQQKDYYYEGQAAAERDYTGGGAMVGGLASGFLLGLIGWGIGYLIVSGSEAKVPHHLVSGLDTTQRLQFEQGYKEYVKKTKKGKFNVGAGIGTVAIVLVTLSASS